MKQKICAIVFMVAMLLSVLTAATIKDSASDEDSMGIQTDVIYGGHESAIDFFKIPLSSYTGDFGLQWEHDYGTLSWWSARYEGPQPIGDADNDGKNELLIGGRDPFMRVMKWSETREIYVEQARIIDPVLGLGYSIGLRIGNEYVDVPEPLGSATGFAVGDITNDGKNEIGVAWGRHFSAFEWNGFRYKKIGMYEIAKSNDGNGWDSTLDCIIGDCDNDGKNEVVVTGGIVIQTSLRFLC